VANSGSPLRSPSRRALVSLFFLFVIFASSRPASATPPPSSRNDKVEWKEGQWPRVTAWEAAGTFAATGLTFLVERRVPEPSEKRLDFEVPLLDPGMRYAFRGRSKKVQDAFGHYSDLGFRMMAFFPYVMDVGVAALGIHRNPDVAGQMALIDLQALTFSGFTQLIASRFAGRARPYAQDCHPETLKTITRDCGGENDNKSFYSGHAAAAFTSAGLTCVHHEHLPLYGGGPVETWACVWALSVASATGLFRIIGDAHYASDVLFGAGVGWFYGYVMPKLLHYKSGKLEPAKDRKAGQLQWMPSFNALDGGGVLSIGATL
jgi:membrane-associated phospholipid phosphatase